MGRPDVTSSLDPSRVYSLPEFYRCTGLGKKFMVAARHNGLDLPSMKVGRRKYVRGNDAIGFIERYARWQSER